MEIFLERTFKRFIVLGEGAVGQAGPEEGAHAGGHHDEGKFAFFRRHGRRRPVRHIAHPDAGLLGRRIFLDRVPFDDRALRVPGLAVRIHRGPVVDDPAG